MAIWIVAFVALLWPVSSAAQGPVCQGQSATIVGSALDDVIEGTAGADVIAALDGHDIVMGGRGADVICGGPGDDIVYGNSGRDAIQGNSGHDLLKGGGGDDFLKGGKGDDTIHGEAGANTCLGGQGTNSMTDCSAPPPPEPTVGPTPEPTPADPSAQVPADFAGVVWLHTNVSSWAVTSPLAVSFGNGLIRLDYEKADVWPPDERGLNGNPWVFVYQDGTWYAATWEWLRFGQTAKNMTSVAGDHIKRAPLENWRPVSGEIYGFMVSGLARDSQRNVLERTSVVMVRWP